jgi:hypothetical protein
MVGSSLAVYFGDREKDYIEKKLEFHDPKGEKIVIDGAGLYLSKINY